MEMRFEICLVGAFDKDALLTGVCPIKVDPFLMPRNLTCVNDCLGQGRQGFRTITAGLTCLPDQRAGPSFCPFRPL